MDKVFPIVRRWMGVLNSDSAQVGKGFRSQNNQWGFLVVTQVYLNETLTNICKICESFRISKEKKIENVKPCTFDSYICENGTEKRGNRKRTTRFFFGALIANSTKNAEFILPVLQFGTGFAFSLQRKKRSEICQFLCCLGEFITFAANSCRFYVCMS